MLRFVVTGNSLPTPLLLLVLLLAHLGLTGCSHDKNNHNGDSDPVPVVIATAEKRPVNVMLRAVANVESIASVAIAPRVDGQIVRVMVKDGQEVSKDQALLQIDPAPLQIQLRAAEANLARDQAKVENSKVRAEHGQAVLAKHFISADDYTQLKTDLESAQATVDADRAARDNAALQLEYATIRAPIAGKLGHIALQVGNIVHANALTQTPLTTLNVLNPIDITFAVPEQNIAPVRLALHEGKTEVHAEFTDNNGRQRVLTGKLTFVDNSIDTSTGTIRLRARFENRDHALWPGQFVTASLALSSDPNAMVVPTAAVQNGPSGTYVYVIDAQSKAEQRAVQVVRTATSDAIVVGVESGERVVIDGQSRLAPGSTVVIVSTPKSTRGAKATTQSADTPTTPATPATLANGPEAPSSTTAGSQP